MPDSPGGRLQTAPIYALIALLLAAIATVAGAGLWSADRADLRVVARQEAVLAADMERLREQLASDLSTVSSLDDFVAMSGRLPSAEAADWISIRVAPLIAAYGFDRFFIVDRTGAPLYAAAGAMPTNPSQSADLAAAMAHQVEVAREAGALMTGGALPLVVDFAVADGRPVVAVSTAMAIGSADANTPILVTLAALDDRFLSGVGGARELEDAQFSLQPGSGQRASIPLVNATGATIGYVTFVPFTPGADVLGTVAPILSISLLLGAALTAGLILRLRRASGRAQQSEAKANHLAFHDVLTGLPNRALFNDRLDQALARVRQGGRPLALLYLDLDRFKAVNDTLGHVAGDALMREVAERLRALVKETDTIARLGGDEFAILYADLGANAEIALFCTRIGETIGRAFMLGGNEAFVGISIGVAIAPEAGSQRDELMRKADIALYRAKNDGRNTYRIFEPEMDRSIQERRQIEKALRHALHDGTGLEVHYQPLFSGSAEHRPVAVEALLRWRNTELGNPPPSRFIPVAEESGLIHALGEWVLRTACRDAALWPVDTLAVNVSPTQFRVAGFADRVLEILKETGLAPHRLELEITESVLVEHAGKALQKLREAGVKIALDDFGTGYSSLNYLGQYAVDKIKIDKSFVDSLAGHQDARAIVIAMVDLARAMGIRVTAEGVETVEQSDFLESIGCDQLQGFLFAKAMPAAQVQDLLFKATAQRLAEAEGKAEPKATKRKAS